MRDAVIVGMIQAVVNLLKHGIEWDDLDNTDLPLMMLFGSFGRTFIGKIQYKFANVINNKVYGKPNFNRSVADGVPMITDAL